MSETDMETVARMAIELQQAREELARYRGVAERLNQAIDGALQPKRRASLEWIRDGESMQEVA